MRSPAVALGALVVTASLAPAPVARALDPDRRIHEYGQRVFGAEAGLPQVSVNAIAQTPDGFLWVATEGGLARFDGLRFTVIHTSPDGTPDLVPLGGLHVDRSGALWIARRQVPGLVRYRDGRFEPVRDPALAEAEVFALAADSRGLWLNTSRGIVQRPWDGPGRVLEAQEDGAPGGFIGLAEDAGGRVWTAGGRGIFRHDGRRFEPVLEGSDLDHRVATSVVFEPDGTLWAGTSGAGILRLRDGRWQRLGTEVGLPSIYARRVHRDRHGNVWISTSGGLARWRGERFEVYGLADGLPDEEVTDIFDDREGNLWLGTRAAGLVRLNDLPMTRFSTREGLIGDPIVETVHPHPDGGLWLGSRRGVVRLGPGVSREITARDGPCSSWLLGLLHDRQGRLWIGTRDMKGGSFCRFEDEKLLVLGAGMLPNEGVRIIHEDRRGTVWVGGRRLYRMEGDHAHPVEPPALSEAAAEPSDLLEDAGGTLWLATRRGLWRSEDGAQWHPFEPEDGEPLPPVHDLLADDDGIWIGTAAGLARLRGGRLRRVSAQTGLFGEAIYSLADDGRGQLWFCTRNGLVRAAKEGLDGAAGTVAYTEYGHAEGLKPPYCQVTGQPRAVRTADGRLWFVTLRGLIVVDPAKARTNPVPPEITIESVEVDGLEIQAAAPAVPRGRGQVQIAFTATALASAERARFRYRLAPFERDWVDAGTRRVAYYTNVPAGRYQFQVIASNGEGVWNERGATFALTLTPPFWATWPFRGAVGVVALGLALASAFAFHRRRLARLRIRHSAILGERTRIARELHDTLAQGLTGIIMQLEAAAARASSAPDRAQEHIEKARALAGRSLGEARRAIWDLRSDLPAADDLPAALGAEVRRMDLPLAVHLAVEGTPRAVSPPLQAALVRITQEGLVNVVRHARASRVDVTLRFAPDELALRIQDDGVGFSEREEGARAAGHFGLLGMRERARAFGGRVTVERAPGGGTVLEVVVPGGGPEERAA